MLSKRYLNGIWYTNCIITNSLLARSTVTKSLIKNFYTEDSIVGHSDVKNLTPIGLVDARSVTSYRLHIRKLLSPTLPSRFNIPIILLRQSFTQASTWNLEHAPARILAKPTSHTASVSPDTPRNPTLPS